MLGYFRNFGIGCRKRCFWKWGSLIKLNLRKIKKGVIKNENIRIESKYDKKFNDLFENTSNIINELKQDLNNKHEKIRELELKVHYLESQIEKKVNIDYDAIKKRKKNLNTEFKRVAKLMKLGC